MLLTMTDENERWLPVRGFEGYYAVSDLGRVKSVARTVDAPGSRAGRNLPERVRRFTALPNGYRQVQLFRDGVGKAFLVHRLVLEAFAGPCPDGMESLHGDGGPSDNRLTNLRWGTRDENIADAVGAGTHPSARTHCPKGHVYTPANTGRKPDGVRFCRACTRTRSASTGKPSRACEACGTKIPKALGRPPKWCSDDCRRTARAALMRERYANQKEKR